MIREAAGGVDLNEAPSATARLGNYAESYPPPMNAKLDSEWQSRRPNQAKFVANGWKLV
jgi:hypothetical protein